MDALRSAALLGDVTFWPYSASQPVVNVLLLFCWAFIFGLGIAIAARVVSKVL